ncbi:MAG: hypothetical protein LBO00_03550 [Zoogloeaceae bacterium]|nr:hypothetical protein [Zoogloeaceae bacterium]
MLFTITLPVTSRYLIATFFWPVIVVFIFLRHRLEQHFFVPATLLSLLAVGLMGLSSHRLMEANGLRGDYYPEEISCINDALERENLSNGIAQYWDAKPIQMFSRRKIQIAQHLENLEEMRWITSEGYFRERYDFAIITEKPLGGNYRLSTDILARLNGEPQRITRCGKRSLYLYGKNKLRARKIIRVGDSYTWGGCALPTTIGVPVVIDEKTPVCEMRKKELSSTGHLTYGPYEHLPPGKYLFEIVYSGSGPEETLGEWDVVLALPKEARVLEKGAIPALISGEGKIVGTFVLEADGVRKPDRLRVEIRAFAHAHASLGIRSLHIRREG